jgi:hypothetical protein
MAELKYKDVTQKIIGVSFEGHKFLGNACLPARQGFQVVIYQRALAWELTQAGLSFQREIDDSFYSMKKSVKSFHPCKSVIQTIYDIVKAHGGELKVEMKEGEGCEFIIQLPV